MRDTPIDMAKLEIKNEKVSFQINEWWIDVEPKQTRNSTPNPYI